LLQRWLPLTLIAVFAIALRTIDLDRRPMHADEANQGVKTGELLELGRYAFDPKDHHGPTLYYAAIPLAWLRGETTLAALTETTLRLVPAIAGVAVVVLLVLFQLGTSAGNAEKAQWVPWPVLVAGAFAALSPPAVYFSRYFIQETLLSAFTLAALFASLRWWQTQRAFWAVAAGFAIGLMFATKASAPVFVGAALAAAFIVKPPRPAALPWQRDLPLALAAAAIVILLFYSSFGRNPQGLRDFVGTFDFTTRRLAGTTGHEKPWWYYLSLFGWQRTGGLVWEQVLFSALALAGAGVGLVQRNRLLQAAAIYTVLVGLALSLTPYKTPWHVIHFVPGAAILAAGALAATVQLRTGRLLAIAAGLLAFASLAQQTRRAAFLRPADPRNPYAYVHSSPDVLKFRPLVETALLVHPGRPVRIVSEEYWPLPWYLRGLPRIGYWQQPPSDCDGALVIASATLNDAVQTHLKDRYKTSLLGLRPGFICVVHTPSP
jgi:uncharacterized protein (TIGR03663 family)